MLRKAPAFNAHHHLVRRQRLIEQICAAGGGVAVIPTSAEISRNQDNEFPYRHDSYFYYLTGFTEPEATLVVIAGDTPRTVLFCRPRDADREVWTGYRLGPEAACAHVGADEAYSSEELSKRLPELLGNQPALWYSLGHDTGWDKRLMEALTDVRGMTRSGIRAPSDIRDVRVLLDEMRLFKDGYELDTLRTAADISASAHARAMRTTRPGMFEYEIEAELLHEFRRHGSQSVSFNPIVASGPNACVLHYNENSRQMGADELLMIDAGCELNSYAGDISRTFPVGGKFVGARRDLYALVLSAQKAAITECQAGRHFNTPHETVVEILSRGLIDLGLLKGSLDEALETGAYRRFYMHRTSHWLGLDVHDVGNYKLDGQWRTLQPDMVLTIEPGCYVRRADDIPEAFWNIGIRIEDDVLITANGPEVLTSAVPKCIKDVEACMAGN
jgi:Xaa-Pro aminopeptidase